VTYLLDTTSFSAMMRRNAAIRARASALAPTDRAVICVITRGEVLYGLARLPQGKRRNDLETEAIRVFRELPCLSVPEEAGDRYAQLKRQLEQVGLPLDENDLWIAATALAIGAVLVSTDSDFRRVDGLQVEDWTR